MSKSANGKWQTANRKLQMGLIAVLVLPLLFGLASTTWAYFVDYARNPTTGYWFERGAVTLAGRINGFLGTGWDGERMVHGGPNEDGGQTPQPASRQTPPSPGAMSVGKETAVLHGTPPGTRATSAGTRVYLDPVLWNQWPQVRFLLAAPDRVTVGLESKPISNLQSPISTSQIAVFAWPYGDWQRAWSLLPAPAEVTFEEGPPSQGDRDPEPYTTYVAFFATPPDPAIPALARFSGGVELLGVAVTQVDGGGLRVRLRWRATAPLADYTVFLHYVRDGERLAQADSRPAGGHYPTTLWRPGDVINDDHYIAEVNVADAGRTPPGYTRVHPLDAVWPGHDTLRFGFWQPESGAVLYLLDEAGNPAGDWIEVPVDGH